MEFCILGWTWLSIKSLCCPNVGGKSRHAEIRYSVVLSNELLDELHGCMDVFFFGGEQRHRNTCKP